MNVIVDEYKEQKPTEMNGALHSITQATKDKTSALTVKGALLR